MPLIRLSDGVLNSYNHKGRDKMQINGYRGACDPCRNDWKNKINQLWENYQEVVKSIKTDGTTYYPDGQGQVDLPGFLAGMTVVDLVDFYTLTVASNIPTANLTDQTTYWRLHIGL